MDGHAGLLTGTAARRRGRPGALALGVGALAVGAATGTNGDVAIGVKSLVDPLFHATSAGGAIAALLLVALAALVCACPDRVGVRAVAPVAALRVLLAAVAVGHAAALAGQLRLSERLGLPATQAVYLWDGAVNTFTSLQHSHLGKAALAAFAPAGGATLPWDVGRGLVAQVPGPQVALIGACLVAAIVAWPWVARESARGRLPLPWQGLLALCAIHAILGIADGGPVSYRAAPCLAVLCMFAVRPPARDSGPGVAWAVVVTATAGGVFATLAVGQPPGAEAMLGAAGLLAAIALLAFWPVAFPRPAFQPQPLPWQTSPAPSVPSPLSRSSGSVAQRSAARAVFAVAAVVLALRGAGAWIEGPVALWLPLEPGTVAYVCDPLRDRCVREAVDGRAAADVYRAAGDDPLKPRRTIIAAGAPGTDGTRLFALVPLEGDGPASRAVGPGGAAVPLAGALVRIEVVGRAGGIGAPVIAASLPGVPTPFGDAPTPLSSRNAYVHLHLTAAALRAHGLDAFALAPLGALSGSLAESVPGRPPTPGHDHGRPGR